MSLIFFATAMHGTHPKPLHPQSALWRIPGPAFPGYKSALFTFLACKASADLAKNFIFFLKMWQKTRPLFFFFFQEGIL